MTAAAALFPMAALAPGSSSCFASNSSTSVSSRRSPKEPRASQQVESPSTESGFGDNQQQWQEMSLGMGVSDGQRPQQSVEAGGAEAAAATAASVAPLRAYPVKHGPQQHLDTAQRGLGASSSPVRPALSAKTSSLLQRKQQFYKHGPEEMRSAGVSTGASPKKNPTDATETAAVAVSTSADITVSSDLGHLEKTGGAALENTEGDRSSRSSLGSSTGNASSSGNSTCTSSPAPCPSPFSFSGTAAAASTAEPGGKAGKGKKSHEVTSPEMLSDLDRRIQQSASRHQQRDQQEQKQQHHNNSSTGGSMGAHGVLGASLAPDVGAVCPDYPLQPQNLGGWDQQQQQGRLVAQHGKGILQQRHIATPQKAAALLPRKLPKAIQRQLRQQRNQQQQALVLQPLRQGRFSHKYQQQQQQQGMQLQAVQGGQRRQPPQQQQQQSQTQHDHQPQPEHQLYSWVPRHQRLPWNGVQQQQQSHRLLQQPLQGDLQHFQAHQHHAPPTQLLLLQQQQQQPSNMTLQEAIWQQQDQQHPHLLTQGHPSLEHALDRDPSNPLVEPLTQQQQAKTSHYDPEPPEQQQHQHHAWESQGLLSLWEQPDLCCWTGNTDSQRPAEGAAAAACAAAPFVEHSIDDRLLLLQQQNLEAPGTSRLQHHQGQHSAAVESGGDSAGAADAAASAAAGGGTPLSPGNAPATGGTSRPVPLHAPDCAQPSQISQESPCSILFSGPKLFNVAADGGDLQG